MLRKYSFSMMADEPTIVVDSKVKHSGHLCSRKKIIFFIMVVVVTCSLILYHQLLHSRFDLPEPFRELRRLFGDGEVKGRRRPDTSEHKVPVKKLYSAPRHKEPVIHVAIVVCGSRSEEALVNLKAMSALTKHMIHFHVFAEVALHRNLEQTIMSWPGWKEDWLQFETHPIKFPTGQDSNMWKTLFKLCASQRLFLPHLLMDVDSLIYVDSDIVFLQPPEKLWQYFSRFNDTQLAAMAYETHHEAGWYNRFAVHPFYKPYGVNSGVMLMNLTRIRNFNWEEKIFSIKSRYDKDIRWGDQDILNILFQFHRELLYTLPCIWNYRPDLCMYGDICQQVQKYGVYALHGNREVFHNKKQPEFKLVYDAVKLYKFGDDFRNSTLSSIEKSWLKMKSKQSHSYCAVLIEAIIARL